jgi:hypothetical protein
MASDSYLDIDPPQENFGQAEKRRRHAWTLQQKKDICLFHDSNPTLSQDEISQHFSELWNVRLDRTIITKTLKHKTNWLSRTITTNNASVKRQRKPSHEALEVTLFEWYQQSRAQGVYLTDILVTDKALAIAREMGMSSDSFKASNGWLYKFKKRHSIRSYCPHPEPAGLLEAGQAVEAPGLDEEDNAPPPVALKDAMKAAVMLSSFVYNNLDDVVLHPADLTYLSGLQSRLDRMATSSLEQPNLRDIFPQYS